jgi:hypothetical protein
MRNAQSAATLPPVGSAKPSTTDHAPSTVVRSSQGTLFAGASQSSRSLRPLTPETVKQRLLQPPPTPQPASDRPMLPLEDSKQQHSPPRETTSAKPAPAAEPVTTVTPIDPAPRVFPVARSKSLRHRKRAADDAASMHSEQSNEDFMSEAAHDALTRGGAPEVDWRAEAEQWREAHRRLQRRIEDVIATSEKRISSVEMSLRRELAEAEERAAAAAASETAARKRLQALENSESSELPPLRSEGSVEGLVPFTAVEEAVSRAREEFRAERKAMADEHSRNLAAERRRLEEELARVRKARDEASAAVREGLRREAEAARDLAIAHAMSKQATDTAASLKRDVTSLKRELRRAKRDRSPSVPRGGPSPPVSARSQSVHASGSVAEVVASAREERRNNEEVHPGDVLRSNSMSRLVNASVSGRPKSSPAGSLFQDEDVQAALHEVVEPSTHRPRSVSPDYRLREDTRHSPHKLHGDGASSGVHSARSRGAIGGGGSGPLSARGGSKELPPTHDGTRSVELRLPTDVGSNSQPRQEQFTAKMHARGMGGVPAAMASLATPLSSGELSEAEVWGEIGSRRQGMGHIPTSKRPSPLLAVADADGSSSLVTPSITALSTMRERQVASEAVFLKKQLEEESRLRNTLEHEVQRLKSEWEISQRALEQAAERLAGEMERRRLAETASRPERGPKRQSEEAPTQSLERAGEELQDAHEETAVARARERSALAEAQLWRLRYEAENAKLQSALQSQTEDRTDLSSRVEESTKQVEQAERVVAEAAAAVEQAVSGKGATPTPVASPVVRPVSSESASRLESELPESRTLDEESRRALLQLPLLRRLVVGMRDKAVEAKSEAAKALAARDRAVTRHADVLGAARVAVTDAAARKDSEVASLHEENRVLVRRLAEVQTQFMRAQNVVDGATKDRQAAEQARTDMESLRHEMDGMSQRVSRAQASVLGASKMFRALQRWQTRVMQSKLRGWFHQTYKVITWREVAAQQERDRRSREAELSALAAEAEDSKESLMKWANGEVERRTTELKRRTELAEETADRSRHRIKVLIEERDSSRLEVGKERHKLAALRDRCFRLETDNEKLTRALHVATLRHAMSVCVYISAFHRSMRMELSDKQNTADSLRGRALRERQMWRARVEAAAGRLLSLRATVLSLPGRIDEIPDRDQAAMRMLQQEELAKRVTKLRQEYERAAAERAVRAQAEGVRVGALRAYEHKLREHSSMSSVMESGIVDERHSRVAMRLEADVQVAAEKVARAKEQTTAAEAAEAAAAEEMRKGIQAALDAKDEAMAELSSQWGAMTDVVADVAAFASASDPVPADDVPFLSAGDSMEEGGGETAESKRMHELYAAEAAEARRLLTLEDVSPAQAAQMTSTARKTLALTNAQSPQRAMVPQMFPTGRNSGLWGFGAAAPSAAVARVQTSPPGETWTTTTTTANPGASGPPPELLSTVVEVFDAAVAESANEVGQMAPPSTKWDNGTWHPERTEAFKAMDARERARRAVPSPGEKRRREAEEREKIVDSLQHNLDSGRVVAAVGGQVKGRSGVSRPTTGPRGASSGGKRPSKRR